MRPGSFVDLLRRATKNPVVEIFNKDMFAMSTVNFSVPEEVRDAFDAAFAGENKSAVIARLMVQAVEERKRQKRRAVLFRQLTADRDKRPRATGARLAAARRKGRP